MSPALFAAIAAITFIAFESAGFKTGYSSNVGFTVVDSGLLAKIMAVLVPLILAALKKAFPQLGFLFDRLDAGNIATITTKEGLLSLLPKISAAFASNPRIQEHVKGIGQELLNEILPMPVSQVSPHPHASGSFPPAYTYPPFVPTPLPPTPRDLMQTTGV